MPDFAHPWALALLPAAPLLAWLWLRHRPSALRLPDLRPFAGLPVGRANRARYGGAILRGLGLAALAVALAGPRWPDAGTRLEAEGVAILFVVDVSGSMAEADFDWEGEKVPRLDAAKKAFATFVRTRGSDLIGLVAFANHPEDVCPLTLSHDVLLQLLDAEQPRGLPDTGTNVGDALAWGLAKLRATEGRPAVVVLVSDGEHNAPPPALMPRQAAQLAASRKVSVYAIDCGDGTGRASLDAVATMTGGRSFAARDAASFTEAYAAIDKLTKQPAASFQYRRYAEGYPAWALAALACFAAVLALEATAWRRIP
ncbi:MAG: VWA domain-containing protein [Gemmataceae bacterium]